MRYWIVVSILSGVLVGPRIGMAAEPPTAKPLPTTTGDHLSASHRAAHPAASVKAASSKHSRVTPPKSKSVSQHTAKASHTKSANHPSSARSDKSHTVNTDASRGASPQPEDAETATTPHEAIR